MRVILFILALFLTSCYGTYYITDAEYSDAREEHLAVTYYNSIVDESRDLDSILNSKEYFEFYVF